MPGSRKLADLIRDPRFAIHGPTFHPEEGREGEWPGEAKVAGRAIAEGPMAAELDQLPEGEFFIGDVREVVITSLSADGSKLVVEWWTPEGGLQRVERA